MDHSSTARFELPYAALIPRLVDSVTRALCAVVLEANVDHQSINRHFVWLGVEFPEGINRHLYDGDSNNDCHPLKTKDLRARNLLPEEVKQLFQLGMAIPTDNPKWMAAFVRKEPTRISKLILAAVERANSGRHDRNTDANAAQATKSNRIWVPSPLAIIHDFLTIPAHPGSRNFVLATLRNYLFERLNVIPGFLPQRPHFTRFSERDIEEAMSVIWTSFRPRFYSKGQDKLPSRGRRGAGGAATGSLVRHFLALNGVLDFTFKTKRAAQNYFAQETFALASKELEFDRAPHLRNLPELGQVVNELCGLPIPVRGSDTIFRGGLKFPSRRGLVCAVHGGPGSGKTSLSLGLAVSLAPLGLRTVFITAEEESADLKSRTNGLIASEYRRLSFFPTSEEEWLKIVEIPTPDPREGVLETLTEHFQRVSDDVVSWANNGVGTAGPALPCRTIIVLDGLHDLSRRCENGASTEAITELQNFIEACKQLEALVILTTGSEWAGDRSLDYLVDIAVHLSMSDHTNLGGKPDRQIALTKARHQFCSPGTHGFQLSGNKGVRFTPQINYQLDRLAIWEPRLPNQNLHKRVLLRAVDASKLARIEDRKPVRFEDMAGGTRIFARSNVFLNGEGSGGKAGLALKIAISPYFFGNSTKTALRRPEKVLIISFLYPEEYYTNLHERLRRNRTIEYHGIELSGSRIEVIHLYPGHLKPATLFNRVMWALDESELNGDAFTTVIVDGIHNVFIQFPEIERNQLFWPQLFSILGLRNVSTIVTHTLLSLTLDRAGANLRNIDDNRSDPLRHALVQKTDFSIEVDPAQPQLGGMPITNAFSVITQSAIGQPHRAIEEEVYWHRGLMVLFKTSPNRSSQGDLLIEMD